MSVGKEGGADKARTNVVKVDVMDASDVAELGETFEVVVDVAFGGGIGWSSTQSSCASDAADDGEVGFLVGVFHKIVEGGIDHLGEASHVSGYSCHLLFDVEGWVLVTNSSTVKIEIHAARLSDEGEEMARGILFGDVDALGGNYVEVLALNLLQSFLPTTSNAHLPALCGEHLHHFESDARCGSDDDGFLLCGLHVVFSFEHSIGARNGLILVECLSDEVHRCPRLMCGIVGLSVGMNLLQQPRHVFGECAHCLHALHVLCSLSLFAAVGDVPIL